MLFSPARAAAAAVGRGARLLRRSCTPCPAYAAVAACVGAAVGCVAGVADEGAGIGGNSREPSGGGTNALDRRLYAFSAGGAATTGRSGTCGTCILRSYVIAHFHVLLLRLGTIVHGPTIQQRLAHTVGSSTPAWPS